MKLAESVELFGGGMGSGCRGPNCGRKRGSGMSTSGEFRSGRRGWYGVDFDGTLAKTKRSADFSKPHALGEPIPEMVAKVKRMLREGKDVRLFTARAGVKGQEKLLKAWMLEHIGQALPITNKKDKYMARGYDDRMTGVRRNMGQLIR